MNPLSFQEETVKMESSTAYSGAVREKKRRKSLEKSISSSMITYEIELELRSFFILPIRVNDPIRTKNSASRFALNAWVIENK